MPTHLEQVDLEAAADTYLERHVYLDPHPGRAIQDVLRARLLPARRSAHVTLFL
jgi:hypothetical protein